MGRYIHLRSVTRLLVCMKAHEQFLFAHTVKHRILFAHSGGLYLLQVFRLPIRGVATPHSLGRSTNSGVAMDLMPTKGIEKILHTHNVQCTTVFANSGSL